ncbi:MAG: hypothetical protein WC197_02415 [Candidatus Gastranaerophilaceae bacterium]|jgi:hypothetical protein
MKNLKTDEIISFLWNSITTFKGHELVKDTTNIYSAKYDGYIDSAASKSLSFTVFELSDKSEIIIDNVQKLLESQAAFYIFLNTKTGWMVAVKNTLENQKKLMQKESIQGLKVKIIP